MDRGDAATVEVDVDDLDEDVRADLGDLLGHLDVAHGQLRDVDEALEPSSTRTKAPNGTAS